MAKNELEPVKRDIKSRVIRYLTVADISLNAQEEEALSRWEYADLLMRKKEKSHAEIVDAIAFRYAVSKWVALNDVSTAQDVFARSRTINKRYLLHLHAERIDSDIERIRKYWRDNNYVPDDKDIAALARLSDSYTKAMSEMPEDKTGSKTPPPVFIFNNINGDQVNNMPLEYAKARAQQIIQNDRKAAEDIDHEEV